MVNTRDGAGVDVPSRGRGRGRARGVTSGARRRAERSPSRPARRRRHLPTATFTPTAAREAAASTTANPPSGQESAETLQPRPAHDPVEHFTTRGFDEAAFGAEATCQPSAGALDAWTLPGSVPPATTSFHPTGPTQPLMFAPYNVQQPTYPPASSYMPHFAHQCPPPFAPPAARAPAPTGLAATPFQPAVDQAHEATSSAAPAGGPPIGQQHGEFPSSSSTYRFSIPANDINHSSPADDVDSKIKEKIWSHQYIDLESLLEKNPTKNLTLAIDPHLGLIVKDATSNPKSTLSIERWTTAFLLYTIIYLQRFASSLPHKATELLHYADTIRSAASLYGPHGWRVYDEKTRKTWTSPYTRFDALHHEHWLRYITVGQSPQQRSPASPGRICFDFNREACHRPKCSYAHHCSICRSPKHSARSCPLNRRQNKNNTSLRPQPPAKPFRDQSRPGPFPPKNTGNPSAPRNPPQ